MTHGSSYGSRNGLGPIVCPNTVHMGFNLFKKGVSTVYDIVFMNRILESVKDKILVLVKTPRNKQTNQIWDYTDSSSFEFFVSTMSLQKRKKRPSTFFSFSLRKESKRFSIGELE